VIGDWPLFALSGHEVSGRDLVFLGGGLFLLAKNVESQYGKITKASTPRLSSPNVLSSVERSRRQKVFILGEKCEA
jgi:hypothetical protein